MGLASAQEAYYNHSLMRKLIGIISLSSILSLTLRAPGEPPDKLQISFKLQSTDKDHGKLIISFKPSPQYHFNKTPPLTVEVAAAEGVQWDKTKQLPKDGKPVPGSQYYGQIEPVEFTYSLSSPRPVEVQAKVTYFYCAKKDGYCAKEVKKLVVHLGPIS